MEELFAALVDVRERAGGLLSTSWRQPDEGLVSFPPYSAGLAGVGDVSSSFCSPTTPSFPGVDACLSETSLGKDLQADL